jgi:hypothetical protein
MRGVASLSWSSPIATDLISVLVSFTEKEIHPQIIKYLLLHSKVIIERFSVCFYMGCFFMLYVHMSYFALYLFS